MTEIKARGRKVSDKPRNSLFKKKVVDKKEPIVFEEIKEDIPELTIKEKIVEPKIEPIMSEEVNEFEVPSFDVYSPIADPIVDRTYNHTETIAEIGDIEEPDFGDQVPTFEDFKESEQPEVEQPKEPSAFDNITNPAMSDMDNKDKKIASEQLVNSVLDGYEMLHQLGAKLASVDEGKIQKRVFDGEIDGNLKLQISEDAEVNVFEYGNIHNEQAKEVFEYDKSFNDKVKPAMIRVFSKRGWGITDEQYLLGAFGKDIAVKMVLALTLKKTAKQMVDNFATYSKPMEQQPPVQEQKVYEPDTIQSKPKEEAPIVEMKVETAKMSVEDIEAQMMEE